MKQSPRVLFCTVMSIAILFALAAPAFAAGSGAAETVQVFIMDLPRAADTNKSGWGHGDLELLNGWTAKSTNTFSPKAIGSYEGQTVYCIEPGIPLRLSDTLTKQDETYWTDYPSELNATISGETIKTWIGRILAYGYTGKNSLAWNTANAADRDAIGHQIATQLLIWETIVGERGEAFEKLGAMQGKNEVLDMIAPDHPCREEIMSHYAGIETSVRAAIILPSFAAADLDEAPLWTLVWDGENYTIELHDDYGVAGSFAYTSENGDLQFAIDKNPLTVTSSAPIPDVALVQVERTDSQQKGLIVWGDGVRGVNPDINRQDIVSLAQLFFYLLKEYDHPEGIVHGHDLFSLARFHEKRGEDAQAAKCYRLSAKGITRSKAFEALAILHKRHGQFNSAISLYTTMLRRGENTVDACEALAKIYEHQKNDISTALHYTRQALLYLSEAAIFNHKAGEEAVQERRIALQCRYARLRRKQE